MQTEEIQSRIQTYTASLTNNGANRPWALLLRRL